MVVAQDTTNADAKKMEKIKEKIFNKYNITDKEYRETLKYYNNEPKKWQDFFNKVIKHFEELKKKAK